MPNLDNAKKALRQAKKREAKNTPIREDIHSTRRSFRVAVEEKNDKKAMDLSASLQQKLDKAAQKRIIPKNRAARLKSRMMKKINSLKTK